MCFLIREIPQEILILLERMLLITVNWYREWIGREIRGEPVEEGERDTEPSGETGE